MRDCENPWQACLQQCSVVHLETVCHIFLVVLVSFYPVGAEGSSEFFVEISNDGEVVDVIWLLCGSIVFTDDKSEAVDCHFAIDEPSELASVPESPISSEECNKEEWCCEPAKFASGGAAYVNGSVNGPAPW